MVINSINIDGFGIYNGFSVNSLKHGVNIMLGNNEAGKTTLLKFLRYTLFGYPRRKEQRMAPSRGGAHGGSVKGNLRSGVEFTLQRDGNDRITLYLAGREYNSQDDLSRFLGHASSELYNNVYAFTLDELVSLASLTDSGVEDKIFSVGMGLGNISLAGVESAIRKQTDEVYKSGGRLQKIPLVLKQLAEKKSEIAAIRDLLPKHRDLSGELEKVEREITEMEQMARENGIEKTRIENYLRCYDSVVKIISNGQQLEELPSLMD